MVLRVLRGLSETGAKAYARGLARLGEGGAEQVGWDVSRQAAYAAGLRLLGAEGPVDWQPVQARIDLTP